MTEGENNAAEEVTEIAPNSVDVSSLDVTETISAAIQGIVEEFDVQPVLFIGAGLARRYLNAPDWENALRYALEKLGPSAQPYSYFVQKFEDDKIKIGTAIADLVFEWAWGEGKENFDPALFEGPDRHVFMKAVIASHLQGLTPRAVSVHSGS